MSIPLLDIVSRESRDPSVSTDWHRQVATAQGILDRHAEGRDTVLLADDVGMGKTYTAMCCMAHTIFQTSENLHKVLLVVPAGFILQKKWEQDLLTFDETYVTRNDPRERHLRPLAVSSYWALARNLTDYTNQYPGNAIHEDRLLIGSVCRMALEWLKLRLHQTGKRLAGQYARLKEAALEEHDPGWLEFCAVYSPDAFFRFLSLEYRNHRQLVLDALKLAGEDGYFVHLMGLFRIFAETQDTHEANVFVIGMGSLGGRRDRTLGALVASWTAARYLASVGETPVAEELFGRMQAAGLDVCSHGASEWARTTGGEWFRKMGQCDMWGLGAYADAFFAGRGDELGRQVLAENGNDVYRLFLDAGVGIVGDKLARSGIELAVVDEAHAWKGWKNGARQFHERIAPYIRKKLIMTATPFQMQEKELENVFQVVAGEGSSSLGLVEELSRGNGLIDTCLRESQGFQDAWNSLSDADGLFLQQAFEDIPCEENADGAVQGNVPRPAASSCPKTCNVEECLGLVAGRFPALGRLVARAQSYHAAVRGLGAELGKVMIRHLKSRKIRLVHAGKDYCTQGLPSLPGGHHTLYTVPGYGSPADLIVQFMGMRAQQLVDADWKRGSNARLLGGITSSFEAFEEGACAIRPDSGLSEETNTYLRGFGKVCAASRHPKVEATARRAVDNYFDGRKTLIFCERLKSQDAIRRTIAAAISSRTRACESLRRQLLADYGCVDLYLSRSLCLARDWEQPTQPMIARAIAEAGSALASLNACCAAPLTRREEAKLLDLFVQGSCAGA